jgi:hypothetical protein
MGTFDRVAAHLSLYDTWIVVIPLLEEGASDSDLTVFRLFEA